MPARRMNLIRRVALTLCFALLWQLVPQRADAITEEQWAEVEKQKIRTKVGEFKGDQIVKVKLKNKSELKGFICKHEEETFAICNASGEKVISYGEVVDIHRTGVPTGAKIVIGIGIGVAATIGLLAWALGGT